MKTQFSILVEKGLSLPALPADCRGTRALVAEIYCLKPAICLRSLLNSMACLAVERLAVDAVYRPKNRQQGKEANIMSKMSDSQIDEDYDHHCIVTGLLEAQTYVAEILRVASNSTVQQAAEGTQALIAQAIDYLSPAKDVTAEPWQDEEVPY